LTKTLSHLTELSLWVQYRSEQFVFLISGDANLLRLDRPDLWRPEKDTVQPSITNIALVAVVFIKVPVLAAWHLEVVTDLPS
jgi:hypothetical protein